MTVKQIIQQLQQDLAYYPNDSETAENLRKEILRLKLLNNYDELEDCLDGYEDKGFMSANNEDYV